MLADTSLVVLLIPVIAGLVGWFTNWLAVRMTLYPVEFIGIGPFGWQGVIPANTESMVSETGLLSHVMLEVAAPEFRFIERSGWWFGLAFGVIQMFVWLVFPEQWILPIAGFLVGYVTNWVAMHLIFEPREPVKIGPFTIQGVFIKRQTEVAHAFSKVIADKVLTTENLKSHIREGESRDKITEIVERYVEDSLTAYEKDPMMLMLVDKEKLAETREDVMRRVRTADMDDEDSPMGRDSSSILAKQSDHMHRHMRDKLHKLDSDQFGGILRPIFQQDEWKLMLAGGVLGACAGVLQATFLFGGLF
jgi:uncharacterized membrane protein YheB (UPF0754 family)